MFKLTKYADELIRRKERRERERIDRARAEVEARNEETMKKWEERKNALREIQKRIDAHYGQSFLPGMSPGASWPTCVRVGNRQAAAARGASDVVRVPEGSLSPERIDAFENAEFKLGDAK